MRQALLLPVAPLLAIALLAAPTRAQETTGAVEGRVVDSLQTPLPAVSVSVSGPALQGDRGTVSDAGGYFRLQGLPVGRYSLRLAQVGREPLALNDIPVRLGSTTSLGQLALKEHAIDLPEIETRWTRPPIDLASPATRHVVSTTTSALLPMDRQFSAVAILLPQANTSYFGDGFNVAGTTGSENTFYVDGVNVTDISGMGPPESIRVPSNFVKEVEIREAGYAAEFGRGLGGGINAVTYSGGNELHGSAFGYFTGSTLTAEPRYPVAGMSTPESAEYDYGVSLGGPLVRDRLWLFAAYNPTFATSETVLPGITPQTNRSVRHSFAGKLTWKASPRTNLTLTAGGDPAVYENFATADFWGGVPTSMPTLDPFLSKGTRGWTHASLTATHATGGSGILDAALSHLVRNRHSEGQTEIGRTEPQFIDHTTGIVSGGFGSASTYEDASSSAKLHGTWLLGDHRFKAGLEYEHVTMSADDHATGVGIIEKYDDTTFVAFYWGYRSKLANHVPGAFVQDSWQVSRRLRLDLGLRWEGQYLYSDEQPFQTLANEWQPRLGLVFQPGSLGTQKLYASYGRFYQQFAIATIQANADNWADHFDSDPRNGDVPPLSRDVYQLATDPLWPAVDDLQGEGFDEFTAGYEHVLAQPRLKLALRGILRNQTQAYIAGYSYTAGFRLGNPGRAPLDYLPAPKREYRGLELSVEREVPEGLSFLASYVLSRNWGNYGGTYNVEWVGNAAGNYITLQVPEHMVNTTGWLPNDRRHVLKAAVSYALRFGLTAGSFMSWQTGTPLSEYGQTLLGYGRPMFLVPRGEAGRLPDLWDINLRLTYSVRPLRSRVVLDVLHLGNPRRAVNADQTHYRALDENGQQTDANPNYGQPTAFQPPQAVRFGWEVQW